MAATKEQQDAAAAGVEEARLDELDSESATSSESVDLTAGEEALHDRVGDEQVCSGDGRVTKVIKQIGRGAERPGQHDVVHVRYTNVAPPIHDQRYNNESVGDMVEREVSMGEGQLPLAVECALRCMRLGETALITAPSALAVHASPLGVCRVRKRGARSCPLADGKSSLRSRVVPAVPPDFNTSVESVRTSETRLPAAHFHVEVELIGLQAVCALTDDGRVRKQVVVEGSRSRCVRFEDLITYSVEPVRQRFEDAESIRGYPRQSCETIVFDAGSLPADLERVILSMYEGERCLARPRENSCAKHVCGGESVGEAPSDGWSVVILHRVRRRDLIAMPCLEIAQAVVESVDVPEHAPSIRRTELCPRPESMTHPPTDGSTVLVGLVPCGGRGCTVQGAARPGAAVGAPWLLLSWCMGQGSVPGYLETAVRTMRLSECAAFDVPKAARVLLQVGPAYEGQSPLRQLHVPELQPPLAALLVEDNGGGRGSDLSFGSADVRALISAEDPVLQRPSAPFTVPQNWTDAGVGVAWNDLRVERCASGRAGIVSFRLALLAATEPPDVRLFDGDEQQTYADSERARGNALCRRGRYAEAKLAYCKALDAIRLLPIYKVIFPTGRDNFADNCARDSYQSASPSHSVGMSENELETRKARLLALHLDIALCAQKSGCHTDARRHASIVLAAKADSAKALFRRGSAALQQGDVAEAVADLQRAAELLPFDHAVRDELRRATARSEHTFGRSLSHRHEMLDNVCKLGTNRQPDPVVAAEDSEPATEASPALPTVSNPHVSAQSPHIVRDASPAFGATQSHAQPSQGSKALHIARMLAAFLQWTPLCRPCARD